ncbi:MAG: cobyric acid synthase, partial [Myxococcota bacterium]
VTAAYANVAAGVDVVVLEGAGSPAEINLRGDMANMEMARHADAAVLLVGDIDRGGVFASLYGTVKLLTPEDRARVAGLVVNRFRGDPAALLPGMAPLAALAEVPVRGVLPWRGDILVEDEDAAVLPGGAGVVDVCALALPTVSNTSDLARLGREPGVGLRWAAGPAEVGNPDLLVLPGSRDTEADMRWMRARGLDRVVLAAAARGVPVLGLCGGYQMLGARLGAEAGLGLLPVATDYVQGKVVRPVRGRTAGGWLLPEGLPVEGYEIHAGRTVGAVPLVWVGDGPDGGAGPDGAVVGLVAGTYVHGLLDTPEVRGALVAALRERKGLDPVGSAAAPSFDALADVMEAHLDLTGLV